MKSIRERLKITKRGKILRRKAGQGHTQSKDSSKRRRRRRGYFELNKNLQKKIKGKYLLLI